MSFEPDPQDYALAAFTVPRIGGGRLRWADYAGKPVVVVAGDVPHVAPGVRRLARLTSGGKSPAVIGLIWDPFGEKGHPTSIAVIQRKAGRLPVPVGYPATPGGMAPRHLRHRFGCIRSNRIPQRQRSTGDPDANGRVRRQNPRRNPTTSLVRLH